MKNAGLFSSIKNTLKELNLNTQNYKILKKDEDIDMFEQSKNYFSHIGKTPTKIYVFKSNVSCLEYEFEEIFNNQKIRSGYIPEFKLYLDFERKKINSKANLSRVGEIKKLIFLEELFFESNKPSYPIQLSNNTILITPNKVFDYISEIREFYDKIGKTSFEEAYQSRKQKLVIDF